MKYICLKVHVVIPSTNRNTQLFLKNHRIFIILLNSYSGVRRLSMYKRLSQEQRHICFILFCYTTFVCPGPVQKRNYLQHSSTTHGWLLLNVCEIWNTLNIIHDKELWKLMSFSCLYFTSRYFGILQICRNKFIFWTE